MKRLVNMIIRIWKVYIVQDRIGYARKLGVKMGKDCQLYCDPFVTFGTEPWLITLGNHVDVTRGVLFLTHEGGIWCARGLDPKYEEYDIFGSIKVGNNVMIGVNSIIMPGVNIGDNVIIAANSVVNKDVPSNSIVGGSPAKPISDFDSFIIKIQENIVPTKHMTANKKREWLLANRPEIFL